MRQQENSVTGPVETRPNEVQSNIGKVTIGKGLINLIDQALKDTSSEICYIFCP